MRVLLVFLMLAGVAYGDDLTIPNVFVADTPALAAEVNANWDAAKVEIDDNNAEIATNTSGIAGKETADAAITKSDEAEMLSANWVNTTNPWAEDELVSTVVVESEIGSLQTSTSTPIDGTTPCPNGVGDVWIETDRRILFVCIVATVSSEDWWGIQLVDEP